MFSSGDDLRTTTQRINSVFINLADQNYLAGEDYHKITQIKYFVRVALIANFQHEDSH